MIDREIKKEVEKKLRRKITDEEFEGASDIAEEILEMRQRSGERTSEARMILLHYWIVKLLRKKIQIVRETESE